MTSEVWVHPQIFRQNISEYHLEASVIASGVRFRRNQLLKVMLGQLQEG